MKKVLTYLRTFKEYSYLLGLLVKRDIKKKYKNSVLGILWSLLSPLLEMILLSIVFSTLLNNKIDNYPVYLLTGRLLYGFFSSGSTIALQSIVWSAGLIKKIYIPKYVITMSKLISGFIVFLISLIDLGLIMIVTRSHITVNLLYAPIYLILLFLLVTGIGLILATAHVFFRDLEYIWGVILTVLMYASAIFYPPDIIPEQYAFILNINPLHHIISGFRNTVYYGNAISWMNVLVCAVFSISFLIIGIVVFERNQDRFIFYL